MDTTISPSRQRDWLTASVHNLRDTCREYATAVAHIETGRWSVDPERVLPREGVIAAPGRAETTTPDALNSSPHNTALARIDAALAAAREELEELHEAAALAYAYGTTRAVRQLLDGRRPVAVEVPRDLNGRYLRGELPTVTADELPRWSGWQAFVDTREDLLQREAARSVCDGLIRSDYLLDHEASELHDAYQAAQGLAAAAYAHGRQAENTLAFVLNVIVPQQNRQGANR
ncbi:hypothetical protein GCM10027160_29340 [Streptomyces calidiresistens]|uniref:Uncharacterized protein n=1 Tax=Streptomyces calidiresistens TaxID=1485586 RepID=A0A7W3T777_9ACTN|nr:hypothetical protein [Streptomyces calidiresistens]MBB0232212.1 hypothetical protein [Streptomyces calidiresistens]